MAMTNHERVGKALELLKGGLAPFVQREITSTYKDRAAPELSRLIGGDRLNAKKPITEDESSTRFRISITFAKLHGPLCGSGSPFHR